VLRLWRLVVPEDTPRTVRFNLCIVLAFALVATALLTRTLLSAVRIDGDVEDAINPRLAAIGSETVRLPVLDRTKEIADDIAVAAAPLGPSLDGTKSATVEIARVHREVRDDTLSVGGSVGSIRGSVVGIRKSLQDLGPVLAEVRDQARGIDDRLGAVASTTRRVTTSVDAIGAVLAGLAADARGIGAATGRTRATVGAIRGHTADIADAGVLRLAELLASRPELVHPGDITAG
jgi:methyl-accepting chemotaxis protein